MKTKLFATICLVLNLLSLALDVLFIADTLTRPADGESYFIVFCFLLAGVFSGFLIALAIKSYKAGIYFLNDVLFNDEGRPGKIALILFGSVTFLGFAMALYSASALLGFAPEGNLERVGLEMLVATGALLFFNGSLGPLYVFLFTHEPRAFRGK